MWVSFHDTLIDQIILHMENGQVDEAVSKIRFIVNAGCDRRVVDRVYKRLSYEGFHLLPIMHEFGVSFIEGNWQREVIRINQIF